MSTTTESTGAAAPAAATGTANTGAAAAAAPAQAPAAPAGASATDWTTGFNEDLKGFISNKGFKDPSQVVDSYRNFEKLMGTPKERLLKLPENMEDQQAMNDIYSKLGKPATADQYKVEIPKEAGGEEVSKWMKETFFENGLTAKQGEAFAKKWNDTQSSNIKASQEQAAAKSLAEQASLKAEWGMAYEQKINTAKKAAREFGVAPDVVDKLQSVAGFNGVMKLFDAIGSKLGEPEYHGSEGGNRFALTPDAAKGKIAMMKSDPGFAKRLQNKDSAAVQEWTNAHKMAFPDEN